jgi:hypothetical protein
MVEELALKAESSPPETVISVSSVNVVVAFDEVNVRVKLSSFVVLPELTAPAVIARVGNTWSHVH